MFPNIVIDLLILRLPDYGGSSNGMCSQAGSSCGKLKRAAEAVAEAIAQPKEDSEDGKQIQLGDILP